MTQRRRRPVPVRLVCYLGLLVALGAALVVRWRWEGTRRAREHDRLGMLYFNQGKLPEAAVELRREIALTPKKALAYYKLGVIELQRGQPQQAWDALSQAGVLGVELPQAPCALGLAAYRMANYSAAITPLQQCLARNPEDNDARYLLAASYLGQARLDEAERSFKELLARQPQNARALYSLGTVYLFRPSTPANNAVALAALRQAAALGTPPPGVFYSLGLAYRRADQRQEAAAALEKAVHRDPQMLEARRTLGLVYRQLGKEEAAKEQFRQVRARWAPVHNDRRLTYLRDEVDRNPTNPMVHFQLGCLHEELKDGAAAQAEFQEAARLDPRLPEAHDHLAQLYARKGQEQDAGRERALADQSRKELGEALGTANGR
jgi:tetratricopeptide (TPR) repeat protein